MELNVLLMVCPLRRFFCLLGRGPSILSLVFPLFWVLWFLVDCQGCHYNLIWSSSSKEEQVRTGLELHARPGPVSVARSLVLVRTLSPVPLTLIQFQLVHSRAGA